ncbi:MAG: transposase [Deltaproteobacteria bacterium]|nr:transposase [Deltaproteobacteria bacterium]
MPPSFGDFLGFNPHLHVLISDGCFHESGMLTVAPGIDRKILKRLFRHRMLRMLLKNGKITRDMIALLDKWRHTGFNVYCGPRILPRKKTSMENLARYIIRASFSRERMTCVPEAGSVIYHSKNGQTTRVFHALELLAAMTVISRTKESRWSATMDTTATPPGANGKKPESMRSSFAFLNRKERIFNQGLHRRSGLSPGCLFLKNPPALT